MDQQRIHAHARIHMHARGLRARTALLLLALALGTALVAWVGLAAGPAEAAPPLKGSFRGDAYGTFANAEAGPVSATLGRSAFQPCPCQGTGGRTLSNTVEAISAGQDGRVLTADELRSTVFTDKTSTTATVRNTSTVSGLDLFDGLVTADAVKAVANTSANARTINSTPNGSTFLNLTIAGEPFGINPAANTRIDLDGIGTVTLKKTSKFGNGKSLGGIVVESLVVDVTEPEALVNFGLPVGAKIIVGHARSGFTRTEPKVEVGGQAYAATANASIGQDLENRIGKAAAIYLGCEGTNGRTETNNIEELDVDGALFLGTGQTTARGGVTPSGAVARTSARVADVNLLEGLIEADAITSVVTDTLKNGKRTQSFAGTRFVNLTVLGEAIPVDAEPNTRIELPGIGFVVINERIRPTTPTGKAEINGLRIVVDEANTLGLPVGAEIIVAHADARSRRS